MRGRKILLLSLLLVASIATGYWVGTQRDTPPLAEPALLPTGVSAEAWLAQTVPARVSPTALSADERNNVEVYSEASPAVVNVTTRTIEMDFFQGAVPVEGTGSGFIVNRDGTIITNYHVVANAQQVQITLSDRSSFPARVVGVDPISDLAVLRINPGQRKLPVLALGDSSRLQVGQKVLAIGNPFGFQGTLTTGVISALERTISTQSGALLDEAIQTDTAINRGNSGGPLLDSQGRVIGVNTLIFSPQGGGSIGIGFATPVNTVKFVLEDLVRHGRVRRPWVGVSAHDVWPELAELLELPVKEGLMVAEVFKGGPADRAGLRGGTRSVVVGRYRFLVGGDIITAIDGQPMTSMLSLNRLIYRKRPGDEVEITYYRGREKRSVKVALQERPQQVHR
ncbi:MAG: S1C family serine protease [Candidatus Acidiferrales bacterium]